MKAVLQRVRGASVVVNGGEPRTIGPGLVILLGVSETDSPDLCSKLAQKCAGLRIFDDENGNLNLSAEDKGYEAMIVSNFTLYGCLLYTSGSGHSERGVRRTGPCDGCLPQSAGQFAEGYCHECLRGSERFGKRVQPGRTGTGTLKSAFGKMRRRTTL